MGDGSNIRVNGDNLHRMLLTGSNRNQENRGCSPGFLSLTDGCSLRQQSSVWSEDIITDQGG